METIVKLTMLAITLMSINGHAAAFPTYEFKAGEQKAFLKLVNSGMTSMCKDKILYELSINKETVEVPAGDLIHIGTYIHSFSNNTLFSCNTTIGFTPKEGVTYILNDYILGKNCYVELVREDLSQKVGVNFEDSVRHPNYSGTCHNQKPIK